MTRRRYNLVLVTAAFVALAAGCGPRVDGPSEFAAAREGATASSGAGTGAAPGTGAVAGTGAAPGPAANGSSATVPGATPAAGDPAAQPGAPVDGPVDTSPIRIGAVGTRTGLVGAIGEGHWAGLEAWAQDVNARGGIRGRPVELTIVDDQGDPGRHVALKRRLIQEQGVTAFVGEFAPLTIPAGIRVNEEFGIPEIGGDASSQVYYSSPLAFSFHGSVRAEGIALGRYASMTEHKRLAVFYITESNEGQYTADLVATAWEENGGTVVVRQSISLAQPDFTAEVLRAQGAGADAVYITTDGSGIARFWSAAERQGYQPEYVLNSTGFTPLALDHRSQTTDSLVTAMPIEPPFSDVPAMQAMRDAMAQYRPDFDRVLFDARVPYGWASGRMFEAAVIEAGGRSDPQSLIDAFHRMRDVTLDGLIPPTSWPDGPHPEQTCAYLVRFNGEAFETISDGYVC